MPCSPQGLLVKLVSVHPHPRPEQENVARAQNTCGPRQDFVAARDALRYTFGIPRPAGFAGLGAHAWRKVATQGNDHA